MEILQAQWTQMLCFFFVMTKGASIKFVIIDENNPAWKLQVPTQNGLDLVMFSLML